MADEVDDPGWDDVIEEAVRFHAALISTSFPAVVLSWDGVTGKASVRPVVRDRVIDPETDEVSQLLDDPISNVPWARSVTQRGGLTFDLQRGDFVMCSSCERAIDAWLSTGEKDTSPVHPRSHERTDAVIVGILHSFANPLPALAYAAGAVTLFGDDVRLGDSSATSAVSLAAKIDLFVALVDTALATWVPVPTDGGLALQTAYKAARLILYGASMPPPAVPTMGAAKVKAT